MGRYGEIWGGVKSETSWGTATWSEYASRDAGAYRIVEPGNPSKQTKSPGETPRVAARRKRCGLYGTLSGECSAAEPTHSYHPWMDVGLCKSGGRVPPPPAEPSGATYARSSVKSAVWRGHSKLSVSPPKQPRDIGGA